MTFFPAALKELGRKCVPAYAALLRGPHNVSDSAYKALRCQVLKHLPQKQLCTHSHKSILIRPRVLLLNMSIISCSLPEFSEALQDQVLQLLSYL